MTRSIDGSVISTVNDRINSTYTVNLMSSVTAKKGSECVEEQLTRVKDMREKFSSFIMSYNGEDLDGGVKVKRPRVRISLTVCWALLNFREQD